VFLTNRLARYHSHVKNSHDVIVLGGGAAGLMCALTAAGRGRRVLVLERANKLGKKILMSGGGRCNFTNLHIDPACFLSANPHFCKSALSRYTQWDFIEMVEAHGIDYHEKETVHGLSGQLFCNESSKQILSMLVDQCDAANVEIKLECETREVVAIEGYRVDTNLGRFAAAALVVATGGLSIPKMGGSGFAYTLAEQFGLELLPRRAGLVPFTLTDHNKAMASDLSGVSQDVAVCCNNQTFREHLLFTHRGLSGPAMLQISSYWSPGDDLVINLVPDHASDASTAGAWLIEEKRKNGGSLMRSLLSSSLSKKLLGHLEARYWPDLARTPLAEWPGARLAELGTTLAAWTIRPAGTEGYRTAEVTLGGVDTNQLSSRTMECSHQPGLYFIGEAVDVTGHLGGFNFQWAWSSGWAAGMVV
jgi:predicted Rossmann fold flavoprotein